MTTITAATTTKRAGTTMSTTTVTVEEAARRLGLWPTDLYRGVDEGRLPAYCDARGRVVIPEDALARRCRRR
jgi:excisionase family DNA binding protein